MVEIKRFFVWRHDHGGKIENADLEILKDVEEITGLLYVEAEYPDLTSLSFLRNLRVIGGITSEWVLTQSSDIILVTYY